VTEADIQGFAEVSGDTNPVQLDETYAAAPPLKGPNAPGILPAYPCAHSIGLTSLPSLRLCPMRWWTQNQEDVGRCPSFHWSTFTRSTPRSKRT